MTPLYTLQAVAVVAAAGRLLLATEQMSQPGSFHSWSRHGDRRAIQAFWAGSFSCQAVNGGGTLDPPGTIVRVGVAVADADVGESVGVEAVSLWGRC